MTFDSPIKSPFLPYFTDFLPVEPWETFPDTKPHEEEITPESNEDGAQQSDIEQPPHAIKQD